MLLVKDQVSAGLIISRYCRPHSIVNKMLKEPGKSTMKEQPNMKKERTQQKNTNINRKKKHKVKTRDAATRSLKSKN